MEQIKMPVLPDEISDLSEAVIGEINCSDCYVEKEGGGFVLTENAKQQIAACNEALAKQEAEANAKLAEGDAKITRLNGTIRDMAASGAVRAALYQCGVTGKPINLALPYLVKKFAPEIADDGTAFVSDKHGRQTVEHAVTRWLASEEGQKFAPRPQAAPGPFASAIKQMRRAP